MTEKKETQAKETQVNAQDVIKILQQRIAQVELDNAILQAQLMKGNE